MSELGISISEGIANLSRFTTFFAIPLSHYLFLFFDP